MVLGLQANLDCAMRIRLPAAVLAVLFLLALTPCVVGGEVAAEEQLDHVTDLMRMGQMDEAEANLSAMQESYPDHLRSWMIHGLILVYSDRFEQGLREAEERLALDPEGGPGLALTVGLQVGKGDAAAAKEASDLLVARFPESADAWDIHGGVLTLLGEGDSTVEALTAFDRALAIDPNHVDALINRGEQTMPTDPAEAERFLRRAVDARPGSTDANEAYTSLLISQNRTSEVIEAFDRWLQAEPLAPLALTGKAMILADQGHYEDALWLVESVLKTEPGNRDVLYMKGALLIDLGRPQEAVNVLNGLIALHPDDEEAETLRSEAAAAVQAGSAGATPNATVPTTTPARSPVPPILTGLALALTTLAYLRRR